MTTPAIDPGVCIGHVHLKVADIDRALAFYCGVLGFQLTQRRGPQAVFISAGGYHHHIGHRELAQIEEAAHHVAVEFFDHPGAMHQIDGAAQLFAR